MIHFLKYLKFFAFVYMLVLPAFSMEQRSDVCVILQNGTETVSLSDNEKKLINGFEEKTGYQFDVKAIVKPDHGTQTDMLLFLESRINEANEVKREFVIKKFKPDGAFLGEIERLTEVNLYIRSVRILFNIHNRGGSFSPFPLFIDYVDHFVIADPKEEICATLLTQAKGITLAKFISYEFLQLLSEEEIGCHSLEIGKQLGNLDALLYIKNHKRLLRHRDNIADNFIYDKEHKQLYFIDLDKMSFVNYNELPDENKIPGISLDETPDLLIMYPLLMRSIACNAIGMVSKVAVGVEKTLIHSHIHKALLFLEKIYKGYEISLQKNNLSYDGSLKYNHLIGPDGCYGRHMGIGTLYSSLKREQKFIESVEYSV